MLNCPPVVLVILLLCFYCCIAIFVFQVANEVIGEMNLKPEEVYLAQGTLRPDLIESASHLASGKAEVIKTHHNDTELIRKLRDEVRPDCTSAGANSANVANKKSNA